MSINLTDEIKVKTKKGKLGAAKQIFLEGDTQTVEKEIQEINSRHNNLSSKHESLSSTVSKHTKQIESNQSQITANKSAQDEKNKSLDANMAKLNTRDDQITESLKGITASGGASVATAVTYDNTSSNLDAATVQGAVDELNQNKIDKTNIVQESGTSETSVMSQKAVSTKLNDLKTSVSRIEQQVNDIADLPIVPNSKTDNKITIKNGNVIAFNGTYITQPIKVKIGDKVNYVANTAVAIRCGLYSSDTDFTADTFIKSLENEESIAQSGYVIFCGNKNEPLTQYKVINANGKIKQLYDNVNNNTDNIKNINNEISTIQQKTDEILSEINTEVKATSKNERKMIIRDNGIVVTFNGFYITNAIKVNKGDSVIYTDNSTVGMECGLYSSNIDFTADTFISKVKKNEPITSNGYVIFNAPNTTPLSDFTVINKDVKIKKDIETLQADVESVNNIVYNSNTAKYYQKGSAQKKFNKKICILAAGQSNCAGRIPAADLPEYISSAFPLENCQIISNKTSGTLAPLDMNTYKSDLANYWAFDLVTYYNIVTRTTNHIDVIKWAVGGTSIDHKGDTTQHWTADYEKIESGHTSLLQSFEEEIRNIIESNGSTFDIRAILWHQGEGDRSSLGTGSADRYYVNLRNLIAYIRGIVGNERLPFITGTVSHNSDQYDKIIESAQKKIESEDPYYILIDMSGATLVDKYHFDANSAEYFGQKAYDALIDAGVFDAEKINPSKPWAD